MMSDRAGNIDNIKFNFGDHECDMTWDEATREIPFVAVWTDVTDTAR